MSFAGNVKSELCRAGTDKKCCTLAETLGALLYANTFSADCIRIVTENRDFAARLPRLFRKALDVSFDAIPEPNAQGKQTFLITDAGKIRHVFEKCGFSAETSVSLHVNFALLEQECCRRSFLRGAFLAGGSVTDPEKRYHLELSTTHLKVSRETGTLMREMELTPKETERKGSSVLYYKQSDSIEDFLTVIGAPVSAMAVMSAKIEKDWRNDANRKTNCDAANVDKAVAAAQEQLAALRKLEESGALDTLPEKLRETARLRRENPEATLGELAELHEPPLSKSAINHRMRRLLALAAQEHGALETARLRIRRFRAEDAGQLFEALSDFEVMRYIEPPFTLAQTREFIRTAGLCEPPLVYALEEKETGFVLGHLIWHPYDASSYELGWVLNQRFWGKGLAQEVTETAIRWAEREGIGAIVIECDARQQTSRHLAQKFGFCLEKTEASLMTFRRITLPDGAK